MLSYPSGVPVPTRALTLLTDLVAATLAQAVQAAAEKAYVVLDGTAPPIDRVFTRSGQDGPYYSGKAHRHGIPQALAAVGVRMFADKGYQGAGPGLSVPCRPRRVDRDTGRYLSLSRNQKAGNSAHARLRAPGELDARTSPRTPVKHRSLCSRTRTSTPGLHRECGLP